MSGPDFAALREAMVERQIARRGIDDPGILEAFRRVPRERFVDPPFQTQAYDDGPLPIGHGQTISQPYVVALMIAAAGVGPNDRVLEVGAGSGYAAALLGQLARQVVAIERIAALADQAAARMIELGFANVAVHGADGTRGWPAEAPYDAILVAAAAPEVPPALIEQLRPDGGRLIIPLAVPGGGEELVRLTRQQGGLKREGLGAVRFVPLIAD